MLTHFALAGLAALSVSLTPVTEIQTHALRFVPKAGAKLETRMTSATQMDSNQFEVVMNGQKVPAQFLPPLDVSYEGVLELVAQDTYVEVAEGRPTKLQRHYETLTGTAIWDAAMGEEYDDAAGDTKNESAIQGEDVEFVWSESESRFERALVDSDKRPAGIDLLDERLDLAGFLPADEVAVGDVWELEPELIDRLLMPGGPLGLEGSSAAEGAEPRSVESTGELSARLVSVEEGRASIEFEGEHVSKMSFATTLERVPVADGTATQEDTSNLELKGRLVWDLRVGRAVSLTVEASVDYVQHTVRDEGQEGPTYESTLTFSGDTAITVEIAELEE